MGQVDHQPYRELDGLAAALLEDGAAGMVAEDGRSCPPTADARDCSGGTTVTIDIGRPLDLGDLVQRRAEADAVIAGTCRLAGALERMVEHLTEGSEGRGVGQCPSVDSRVGR